ncbi:hypothetical protein PROFUN_09953 [Planoprotostelium fungivorum]|uniref:Uncharacterized protein n=1 Tax=Planoprotostelium fungivorum TaxID=1890364 RepID=A0A2P6NGE7_9EUKA|nr:hypothetical protein PROFUN_09953 [Planoprotostelium fungivorum]
MVAAASTTQKRTKTAETTAAAEVLRGRIKDASIHGAARKDGVPFRDACVGVQFAQDEVAKGRGEKCQKESRSAELGPFFRMELNQPKRGFSVSSSFLIASVTDPPTTSEEQMINPSQDIGSNHMKLIIIFVGG